MVFEHESEIETVTVLIWMLDRLVFLTVTGSSAASAPGSRAGMVPGVTVMVNVGVATLASPLP
jgi:hypothetical protein